MSDGSGPTRRGFLGKLGVGVAATGTDTISGILESDEDSSGFTSITEVNVDYEGQTVRAAIYPDGFTQSSSEIAEEVAMGFEQDQHPDRLSEIPFNVVNSLERTDPLHKLLNPKINSNMTELDSEQLKTQKERLENIEYKLDTEYKDQEISQNELFMPFDISKHDENFYMSVEGLRAQPELDTVDAYGRSTYFGEKFEAQAYQHKAHIFFYNHNDPKSVLMPQEYEKIACDTERNMQELDRDAQTLYQIFKLASIKPEELEY